MKKKQQNLQKRKKWLAVGMVALLMAGMLTGCGSSVSKDAAMEDTANYVQTNDYNYGMADDVAMKDYEFDEAVGEEEVAAETAYDDGGTEAVAGASSSKNVLRDTKKIIKTYHYQYETEKFDEAYDKLMQLIAEYDGYVASSDLTGTTRRNLSMTAKIPADKSDDFAKSTGTLGTLQSKKENADDVTLEYTDTESHITTLKTEQQRLNDLLKDADNLETIIALESRLSEVRYELENYQSRKNQLDSLITYSTVHINLAEVKYEIEVDEESFLSRVSAGLKTTLRDISDGAVDFAVWFIVNLPYFVIWIIIIFIIVKIVKLIRKRRKAKKGKKEIKKEQQAEAQEVKPAKAPETAKNDKSIVSSDL